jgi:(4S)-4-hydroxy-5-phosphonooxypentane-2,3-dione isomerase
MSLYAVIVSFELQPGEAARFLPLARLNAAQSLSLEPACRRFDVLEPAMTADEIVLYEVYDDERAFEEHTRLPHVTAFIESVAPLVKRAEVKAFRLRAGGSVPLSGES